MMEFEFSGKVIEVYYTDPELSTAAVVYKEGDAAVDYFVSVDNRDDRWLSVLEEVTLEQIDHWTRDRHEAHRDVFRAAFEDYAGRVDMKVERELDVYLLTGIMLNFDTTDVAHNNELFKVKLAIFDTEIVKASDRKDVKTEIRVAKTPLKAIIAYSKLLSE
jgi:hypothetical protein